MPSPGITTTDVVIVGAGPVGLCAAMALDARGIRSVVLERRAYLQPPSVKCNHVAARTMERFRRFGIADAVRAAGLPGDHPQDVSFRTTLTGTEIGRIPIPARDRRFTATDGADSGWQTPEPPHRINQTFLEPILLEHVAGLEHVTVLNDVEFERYEQTDDHAEAVLAAPGGGDGRTIRARFLIGADGGRSAVRKQMGVALRGDPVIQQVMSTCIRAEGLYDRMPGARAWGYYTFNPRRNGHVYSIDGESLFIVHTYLTPAEAESGSVDRLTAIRHILGVDDGFPIEVVSEEDWVARRLVADRFRDGRVFIAGDAAHLWVPYAGFGMNAGIADAFDLAWSLAGSIEGWAGPRILDAYEAERLPITAQVSRFAMAHAERMIAERGALPPQIEDDGPAGDAARRATGERAYELNVQQFAAEGLNFGYVYDASPVIAYDGEAAPEYGMGWYVPSTVPGCRMPHFRLADGTSAYDLLGPVYTLFRFDPAIDVDGVQAAAAAAGVPLDLVDVPAADRPATIDRRLVIARADQHVAWRGDDQPADPADLFRTLGGTGAAPAVTPDAERSELLASR